MSNTDNITCSICHSLITATSMDKHMEWHGPDNGETFPIPPGSHIVTEPEFAVRHSDTNRLIEITSDWPRARRHAIEAIESGARDVTIFVRRRTTITTQWDEKA